MSPEIPQIIPRNQKFTKWDPQIEINYQAGRYIAENPHNAPVLSERDHDIIAELLERQGCTCVPNIRRGRPDEEVRYVAFHEVPSRCPAVKYGRRTITWWQ